ncbi:hypothetical protein FB451DRAFT_1387055 [Mycena latifolia]|nr:hypothetical protein FB451DRAFT_1387055 [Mycena latifolia]
MTLPSFSPLRVPFVAAAVVHDASVGALSPILIDIFTFVLLLCTPVLLWPLFLFLSPSSFTSPGSMLPPHCLVTSHSCPSVPFSIASSSRPGFAVVLYPLSLVDAFLACGLGVSFATDETLYQTEPDTKTRGNRPVLLLGLRLGLDGVNPVYYETIKMLYTFPQSDSIAGGRPSSYYFVGVQGDGLFYLNPHHSRPAIPLRPRATLAQPRGLRPRGSMSPEYTRARSLSPEFVKGGACPDDRGRAHLQSPTSPRYAALDVPAGHPHALLLKEEAHFARALDGGAADVPLWAGAEDAAVGAGPEYAFGLRV